MWAPDCSPSASEPLRSASWSVNHGLPWPHLLQRQVVSTSVPLCDRRGLCVTGLCHQFILVSAVSRAALEPGTGKHATATDVKGSHGYFNPTRRARLAETERCCGGTQGCGKHPHQPPPTARVRIAASHTGTQTTR